FLCSDQLSGQANVDTRRSLVPVASDLALLGGARRAGGRAEAFDFVVIGCVLRAAQVEVGGHGRVELCVAGQSERRDVAKVYIDGGGESRGRGLPNAQPSARR